MLDLPAVGSANRGVCTACGAKLPTLAGQCPVCGLSTTLPSDDIPTEVAKQEHAQGTSLREPLPSKPTLPIGRRSTTAQIKAVFADSSSPLRDAEEPDGQRAGYSGATELLEQALSEAELQETMGRSRTPAEQTKQPGAPAAPPRTESDPFAMPSLPETLEETGQRSSALEPEDAQEFIPTYAAPRPEEEAPSEQAPAQLVSALPQPGQFDPTLPPLPRPTREQAALVEEALSRATAAERLDEASRALDAGADHSNPRARAIHAGGSIGSSRDSQGVRVVLEPPLAPGRKRTPEVSYDDPTTIYPVLADQIPASELPPLLNDSKTERVRPLDVQQEAPSAEVCPACGEEVLASVKFCGQCGSPIGRPPTRMIPSLSTETPAPSTSSASGQNARLVLLRGGGRAGSTWALREHVNSAGRLVGALLFSNDPFMSPLHATFYYRNNRLYVRDERSRNGVFIRLRRPEEVRDGDRLCIGRQLLLLDSRDAWQQRVMETRDKEETQLLASPAGTESIVIVRVFSGGDFEVHRRHQRVVSLGRSDCDVNFPEDDYLSQRHARVLQSGNYTVVEDLGSSNGTFLAVRRDQALEHGDEIMIGGQVLRVENG